MMILASASAFLFDLDGTLISSVAAGERVWGRWAARQGIDVAAFLLTIHGKRGVDVIRNLGLPGLDPVAEAELVAREEIEDCLGVMPIAGADRFIAALPPERWAIVTSSPRELARVRLRAAGIAPPLVLVTAEDIERGKPAPDCFVLGARRLGFDVPRCVVFEDAPAGIAAGQAAGAAEIVVVDAIGSAHSTAGTHPVIKSFDELAVDVGQEWITLRRRPVA